MFFFVLLTKQQTPIHKHTSYEIRTRGGKKKKKKKPNSALTQGHKIELCPSAGSCSAEPSVRSVLLTLSGDENDRNETITLEDNAEALEQPHAVVVRTVKSAVMNYYLQCGVPPENGHVLGLEMTFCKGIPDDTNSIQRRG